MNWITIAIEKYFIAEEFKVLKSSNRANKAHLKGLLKAGGSSDKKRKTLII